MAVRQWGPQETRQTIDAYGSPSAEGEEVVRGPSGLVSVISRVNASAYSTIAAALTEGDGKTVYFPPGTRSVSAALVPPTGTTVELHPNAVIEQTTALTPVFDLLDVPGVKIIGGQLEWNGSRVRNSGSSVRGSSDAMMCCGVWTNSHRSQVIGTEGFGFQSVVNISGWDTGAGARVAGRTQNVVVQDVGGDTVSFVVLAAGTKGARVHGVHGSYASWTTGTTSPEPPHLIYFSESGGDATMNVSPLIGDCYALAGDTAAAYQFKGITGGSAFDLHAGVVPSLLKIMNAIGFSVERASAEQTTSTSAYSALDIETVLDTDVMDCTVRDVWVKLIGIDAGLARITGTKNTVDNVRGKAQTATASTSTGYTNVRGIQNTARRIDIVETGAAAKVAVHVNNGSGHVIEDPTATGVVTLSRISTTDTTLTYDPRVSTVSGTAMIRLDAPTSTRLILAPTQVTVSIVGGTIAPNPSRQTSTAVVVSDATLTISNPTALTVAVGLQHEVKITNTSGGALTVTWGTQYVFKSAWASPATGTTTFITFEYDGTNWVEKTRTV